MAIGRTWWISSTPGQVEPLQVLVALVLVDRLAERGGRGRQPHVASARGQQLGDGQAGPVAAPVADDDAPPGLRARQHVPGTDHRSARQLDVIRPGAGGDDHAVGRLGEHVVRGRNGGVAHVAAGQPAIDRGDQAAGDLRVAGRRGGQAHLAARPVGRRRTRPRACRACAHTPRPRRRAGPAPTITARALAAGRRRQPPLEPGPGVDRAGDREAGVVVADAALVAADAGHDRLAGAGLGGQRRVGDHRPRHAAGVAVTGGDQPSASAGSRIRPVAITGTATASLTRPANGSIALCSIGEGGTMSTEPRYWSRSRSSTDR